MKFPLFCRGRGLNRFFSGSLAGFFFFLVFSCSQGGPETLQRQDLFSLSLGKSENSLDLFQLDGIKTTKKNRLYMRNGLFYISNGNSSKIMQFSSYGDLLGLLYNPQENPKPVLLGTETSQRMNNKTAFPYFFNDVGEIAVSRSGMILAEDRIPDSQKVYDEKLGAVFNHVILRFNEKGEYQDFLGQEGLGGAPLPYIEALSTTASDEIVAVTRTTKQWRVYWYGAQGNRRYAVDFFQDQLPVPDGEGFIPSLLSIRPDPELPLLYVHISYYPLAQANSPNYRDSNRVESRVYLLNLLSGAYESWFSLPYETQRISGVRSGDNGDFQALQSFIGISIGSKLYFVNRAGDNLHQLTVLDRSGRVLAKRLMNIEDSKLVELNLHVSFEGVISALLGFEDKAEVAWWRLDKLFDGGRTWEWDTRP